MNRRREGRGRGDEVERVGEPRGKRGRDRGETSAPVVDSCVCAE